MNKFGDLGDEQHGPLILRNFAPTVPERVLLHLCSSRQSLPCCKAAKQDISTCVMTMVPAFLNSNARTGNRESSRSKLDSSSLIPIGKRRTGASAVMLSPWNRTQQILELQIVSPF